MSPHQPITNVRAFKPFVIYNFRRNIAEDKQTLLTTAVKNVEDNMKSRKNVEEI